MFSSFHSLPIEIFSLLGVIQRLEMFGIPVPRYALVNREEPYQEVDFFVEEEDFVEVHGNRFWKPFVEKPVDGEIFLHKNIN